MKKYLPLSEAELKKLADFKSQSADIKVEPEWLEIAEFGGYFGYDGIQAILNNEIEIEVVRMLLAAQRKVWASQLVDRANVAFIASVSAQSKRPTNTFKKAMKNIIARTKVEK